MSPRYAYAAVIEDNKYGIGRADENIRGYTPMEEFSFETWVEAEKKAEEMNHKLGLSPREALMIVASTMRPKGGALERFKDDKNGWIKNAIMYMLQTGDVVDAVDDLGSYGLEEKEAEAIVDIYLPAIQKAVEQIKDDVPGLADAIDEHVDFDKEYEKKMG